MYKNVYYVQLIYADIYETGTARIILFYIILIITTIYYNSSSSFGRISVDVTDIQS